MTKLTIEMECDNDAFQDQNFGQEVANILHGYAWSLEDDTEPEARVTTLRDQNGNTVGTATITCGPR